MQDEDSLLISRSYMAAAIEVWTLPTVYYYICIHCDSKQRLSTSIFNKHFGTLKYYLFRGKFFHNCGCCQIGVDIFRFCIPSRTVDQCNKPPHSLQMYMLDQGLKKEFYQGVQSSFGALLKWPKQL